MGFYVEVPDTLKGKAAVIQETFNAAVVTQAAAEEIVRAAQEAVICVVENDLFDAAAFCYSPDEFERFSHVSDPRRKTWLVIKNRPMIEKITGFVPN